MRLNALSPGGLAVRCAHCQGEFTSKHPRGRFCGDACRAAAWRAGHARDATTNEARRARDQTVRDALLLAREAVEEALRRLDAEDAGP